MGNTQAKLRRADRVRPDAKDRDSDWDRITKAARFRSGYLHLGGDRQSETPNNSPENWNERVLRVSCKALHSIATVQSAGGSFCLATERSRDGGMALQRS